MAERSEYERRLDTESRACRRCIAALETVDTGARRRILAWLLAAYADQDMSTGEGEDAK